MMHFQFQVMHPKAEKYTKDLHRSTKKMIEQYAELKTPLFLEGGQESNNSKAQSLLYSIIRQEAKLTGQLLISGVRQKWFVKFFT